jgi:WD40 repeat protein
MAMWSKAGQLDWWVRERQEWWAGCGLTSVPKAYYLASAGDDETVRLSDPATGEPIRESLTDHNGSAFGVAFNPTARSWLRLATRMGPCGCGTRPPVTP